MNMSVGDLQKKLAKFFGRYHYIIFFVFVVGGLGAAIVTLNMTVLSEQNDGYTSAVNSTEFDQITIEKVKALKKAGEETDKVDLSGRYNPF